MSDQSHSRKRASKPSVAAVPPKAKPGRLLAIPPVGTTQGQEVVIKQCPDVSKNAVKIGTKIIPVRDLPASSQTGDKSAGDLCCFKVKDGGKWESHGASSCTFDCDVVSLAERMAYAPDTELSNLSKKLLSRILRRALFDSGHKCIEDGSCESGRLGNIDVCPLSSCCGSGDGCSRLRNGKARFNRGEAHGYAPFAEDVAGPHATDPGVGVKNNNRKRTSP